MDAIIQLPSNLFLNVTISVDIMLLRKNKSDNAILFVDASGEFVKVTKNNRLSEENIQRIVSAVAARKDKEYFCRLFKKNMGVSYLQYVYQVRTTAVCRELESSEDPIGEIAERHGFRDPKMLNQYFKEIYGCTPSEKRKFFREVTLEESEQQ